MKSSMNVRIKSILENGIIKEIKEEASTIAEEIKRVALSSLGQFNPRDLKPDLFAGLLAGESITKGIKQRRSNPDDFDIKVVW